VAARQLPRQPRVQCAKPAVVSGAPHGQRPLEQPFHGRGSSAFGHPNVRPVDEVVHRFAGDRVPRYQRGHFVDDGY